MFHMQHPNVNSHGEKNLQSGAVALAIPNLTGRGDFSPGRRLYAARGQVALFVWRYCGNGGSGARAFGFGVTVTAGAGEGRTRFCASNPKCSVLCVSM